MGISYSEKVELTIEQVYKYEREVHELRAALHDLVSTTSKLPEKNVLLEDAVKRGMILLSFPISKGLLPIS